MLQTILKILGSSSEFFFELVTVEDFAHLHF
jgi:hypothetical protein